MNAPSKLLYVISSPRGEQSESRAIADEFVHAYQRSDPSVEVDVLDLWNEPLPVYGGKGVAAKMAVFAGQTPSGDAGRGLGRGVAALCPLRRRR